MKKATNLLLVTCVSILFNHCTSNIDTDADKNILPIVSVEKEVTDITEVLNPHVDLENLKSDEVVAIVPSTLSLASTRVLLKAQSTNQELDYSPLLKYTVSGKLLPVFQKGTFEQNNPLKVIKITRLLNLKYYAIFSSPIKHQGYTCTLVEISPPTHMRCIDQLNYPVSHVDNAHFLPQKEDQLRNFVFADAQGNIYYASQTTSNAGQKASYRLFQRNPANELRLVSETEFSDRLIKNHQDKFYSMCEAGEYFCEISPSRTRIYDFERSQLSRAITSIHPISEDYVITRGDPVLFRLDFKLFELGSEVYDQSNPNNMPISIYPNIDNNHREQGEILYGSYEYFRVNGIIYSLSNVAETMNNKPTGAVQSYFTKFKPSFSHNLIEPNTQQRWTASDLLANQKIVVSMELSSTTSFEGLKYKTYIIDLNTLSSTPISSLDQMNITSMRSINEKEILMIGRATDDPIENTKLFKFHVETGDMTTLRTGSMLEGTTLYIKN